MIAGGKGNVNIYITNEVIGWDKDKVGKIALVSKFMHNL